MNLRRTCATLAFWAALVAPAGAQSLQHDTDLPIEITADTLEVLQDEQLATFAGNVDAVQGDLVLSADQLRVHYRRGADPALASDGTIRRIEAIGNVFLTSPRETAQGDVGVYDLAEKSVTLEGSVVLTRDDNVIRGQRLEYDLESGRSTVVAGVPSGEGGAPAERVRAIFTPSAAAEPPAQPGIAPSAGATSPGAASAGPPTPAPKPTATQ